MSGELAMSSSADETAASCDRAVVTASGCLAVGLLVSHSVQDFFHSS